MTWSRQPRYKWRCVECGSGFHRTAEGGARPCSSCLGELRRTSVPERGVRIQISLTPAEVVAITQDVDPDPATAVRAIVRKALESREP